MDLRLSIFGEDKASSAFDSVGSAARQAAKALYDFSKESVKAALDQEKADRQLALAAKELTGAFKEQASAIQSQLGVQDDMVQGIQALLLQYGEAPDKVDATTRAILDFSAATGQDALSAAKALTSGVESGKGAFKEYGVQLELTGKRSKDLEIATEALKKKFGGAAQNEADSLEGTVRGLSVAFGELQESFGGWLLDVAKSSGVLDELKVTMSGITQALAGPDAVDKYGAQRKELALVKQGIASYGRGEVPSERISSEPGGVKPLGDLLARQRQLEELIRSGELALLYPNGVEGGPSKSFVDQKTKYGHQLDSKAKKFDADEPGYRYKSSLREDEHNMRELAARDEDRDNKSASEWFKAEAKAVEAHSKTMREAGDGLLSLLKGQKQQLEKEAQDWAQAGTQIGGALVGGLMSQLNKIGEGGEFDIGSFIASLMPMVLGAIGNVVAPGIGGVIGGGIGSLFGGVVGMGSASKQQTWSKRHAGGWIDMSLPRYHQGSWIGGDERPAILQTGERVLSRSEVGRMGGAARVDAAARRGGGGSITINVSSLDSRSTAEFFTQRGGKGFEDALKTGQGPLARVLGKGRLY